MRLKRICCAKNVTCDLSQFLEFYMLQSRSSHSSSVIGFPDLGVFDLKKNRDCVLLTKEFIVGEKSYTTRLTYNTISVNLNYFYFSNDYRNLFPLRV